MRVDFAEIAEGFRISLQDFGAVLTPVEPWLWVVIGLFCGAWMVQFLDRLMQVLLFGWLRWLRRLWLLGFSGWCVFPGCGTSQGQVPALPQPLPGGFQVPVGTQGRLGEERQAGRCLLGVPP